MSTTLSNGFILLADGDKGATVWNALEDLIQQVNDHTHNGTDSERLSSTSSVAVTQDLTIAGSGAWTSDGGGTYHKTVTLPSTLTAVSGTFDNYNIQARDYTTKEVLFLTIVKASSTTFTVYSNDSTLEVTFLYT